MSRCLVGSAMVIVVVGVALCILAIWEFLTGDAVWRAVATCGVLFAGELLVLMMLLTASKLHLLDDSPT